MAAAWPSYLRVGSATIACALLAAVGGCSTVADLNGIPHAGYQKDGSYVLTSDEQGLGCRELQERQVSLQQQLQDLPAKAVKEMQELPKTVSNAWSRLVGSSDQGVPALAEYNEAKAEAQAVSLSMARKGCGGGPVVETATVKR